MSKPQGTRWKWIVLGLLAAAVLGAAGWLLLRYYPLIQGLTDPERMAYFREKLQSFGGLGVLLLLGMQFLQVLSGLIPSLPIQISAGLTYGALGGLLICLTGIALGSTVVFLLVKRYGQPVIDRMLPKEKQSKLSFLQDSKKLEPIVFLLYLIPALPKDAFTYLAALTPIRFGRFMLLSMVGRVPMIFCSTFASGALINGRYGLAISVFVATCVAGLLGMLCAPKLMAVLRRKHPS